MPSRPATFGAGGSPLLLQGSGVDAQSSDVSISVPERDEDAQVQEISRHCSSCACSSASALLAGSASAKPTAQEATVKLGFITKFPVDFFFTLQNAAKKWDKATPGATVIYAQGKSATDDAGEIAAIQNMVAQGVKGIAITPTSAAVSSALDKAVKQGVKVVLIDNDIPSWKKKTSVVATNNFKGGLLAGKFLSKKLKAGDTLGILEGVPGVAGARGPGRRHARRPRQSSQQDQGRREVANGL